MNARMELHVALSLRLDAIEAYRLANAYRAEVLREMAVEIQTLGEARGWSIWAAHYMHPDIEFVDTGGLDTATLLRGLKREHRAEVLREAADKLTALADETEAKVAEHYGTASGVGPGSAEMVREAGRTVRSMADAAGKDTASSGETTQAAHAPSVPGTCARARGTYDWVHNTTPKRETPCRPYPELHCVASCLDSEGGEAR